MELSIVLVGAVLLLMVSFYWIVKPLRTEHEVINYDMEERDEKEAVFSTLNEIEFDYRTKKISEEDYHSLKNEYEAEAKRIMREQDQENDLVETSREVEIEIEQEIEAEIEQEIQAEIAKRRKLNDEK